MKNKYFIIISSAIACIIMYCIEQHLGASYINKTISKLCIFTLLPYTYMKIVKKQNIVESLNLKTFSFHRIKVGIILGFCSFTIVLIGYMIFSKYIDIENILQELNKINVSRNNFIYVGLYIIFINSFLEEFFFRGFVFLNIYEEEHKLLGYIYSAFLFAIYHMAMIKTWFNPYLIGVSLISLMVVSIVFNYLNTISKNFINSWIVHMMADSAIILIGLNIFIKT